MKGLFLSLLRSVLRPFGWGVAPAPALDLELNNTAAVRGVSRALAATVRAEITTRGLDVPAAWLDGIEDELQFWFSYFATDAAEFGGREGIDRLARPHPFQFEDLFATLAPGSAVSVLDVGAGPLSQVGCVGQRVAVRLRAVDPLAPAYDAILRFFRIVAPVATEFGIAESLVRQFPGDRFELVHARNALDHAVDPVRCIQEMAALAKPGGWIVLDHADREADHERFQGLHRWNFDVADGRYRIEDADGRARVVDHDGLGLTARFEHYGGAGKQFTRVFYRRHVR